MFTATVCSTSVAQPWPASVINARHVPVNRDCQAYVLFYGVAWILLQTVQGWTPFYVVVSDLATAAVTLQL